MKQKETKETKEKYPPLRGLKVGDRVRLVHYPTEYIAEPWRNPHEETRQLYKRLLKRRRSVRVCEIDEWDMPWIACQFRGRNNRLEYHYLLIGTESGWTKVKSRKKTKVRRKSRRKAT